VPASDAQPETPEVADRHQLDLAKGRRVRTRVAGVFLFLPLLARVRFDQLVEQAAYPGSEMIPATAALLSLLALKLLDKERRSHISDFAGDTALGLFAGLNVLPKTSFATRHRVLLSHWTRPSTPPALGLGQGAGSAAVPRGARLLPGFPRHPVPR
jgi:hypothetical protein